MAACGLCGAGNPDGYRFCGRCGSNLAVSVCPSCGEENGADQSFCGQCGASLTTFGPSGADGGALLLARPGMDLSPAPDGGDPIEEASERAPVATGDGFVHESGILEERKLATVLFADVVGFTSLAERTDPELVTRMVDSAFRRLSQVVQDYGGRVDRYMGDSVMAVFGVPVAHDDDAARAVAAGLAMRELGGDLAFSIGINSGELMAAYVGRANDFTVIGDTVNVAARLEKVATAGEVLCGRLTVDLAHRSATFRERRPMLLKGKSDPVEVWEAIAVREDRGLTADPDKWLGPPLIGRSDELSFLTSQWRRVCHDRRAHVVLICGDAGSGKTRLLGELLKTAERDGTVIRATYPAYGSMGGPRVAAEVSRQLGLAEDEEVNARIRSATGVVDPSLQSVDPSAMRQEQLWAFRRLLFEKSQERPILVAIDDMHRSGDQTLELLSEIANRIDDMPLLTVLVGRSEPSEWLSRFPVATKVPLGALSRQDAKALVAAFAGDKKIAPESIDFLVERANGNPLYLRELLVMARDRGLFVEEGDQYRLRDSDAPALSIPASLQALLAARLDALDPAQKLVVQHVAVLGEAATTDQIIALGSPEATLALRALTDVGLLRHGTDGRFDAADPLLREVAYETLPRNVRGELHRRAATTSERPEEKARHLDRAAGYLADDDIVAAEAAEALAEAGEAMVLASRHLDGIRLLERAVDRGCMRTSALLMLARTQSLCGRNDDALETLTKIADDPADPSVAIERDHTAAGSQMFVDPAWAVPRLEKAAERWKELGNAEKHAWAKANSGVALFYLSRMEEAGVALEEALALFESLDDRNGVIATTSFLCLVRPIDKRVPGWLADALEFAEIVGDRSREMTVLTTLAWHHFFRTFCGGGPEYTEAAATTRRMAELAQELGVNDLALQGWSLLAILERMTGRIEEAALCTANLDHIMRGMKPNERWLAWAAIFSVTMAKGEWGVTPPFPPDSSSDPVTSMATLVVEAELTLSGRVAEALSRFRSSTRPRLGPISDLSDVFPAISLVVSGRGPEALPWIERAAQAAAALEAWPALLATKALRAMVTGDLSELPEPSYEPGGLADVLILRARALTGDAESKSALRRAVVKLAMPGLDLSD
ncbi:MAG: adenylate/guanylate cyclase domain-containing protein [Acidimicrobiales bacterium]